MNLDPSVILLIITIITGPGKQNITHQEPMPTVEVCFEEAAKLARHRFPDAVAAKGLVVGCAVPTVPETPS